MGTSESTSGGFVDAFVEELARLGWTDGRNARFEQRWTNGDVNRASAFATELVAAQPDVIFCSTTPVTAALHRETSTIPIVFAIVSDPVGSGLVAGLPRPGGNITGFTMVEAAMGGKWLSLLKEIAPGIKRAAFMFNPDTAPAGGKYFLASFEAAAGAVGIEPVAMPVRSDAEIETAIAALGARASGPCRVQLLPGRPWGNDHFIDGPPQRAGDVRGCLIYRGWRPNRIWGELDGHVPPRRRLCRSHPARRETGRSASAEADEIRD